MIKIEHNIPIPENRRQGSWRIKYPFREMKIGDSILLPKKYLKTQTVNPLILTGLKPFLIRESGHIENPRIA